MWNLLPLGTEQWTSCKMRKTLETLEIPSLFWPRAIKDVKLWVIFVCIEIDVWYCVSSYTEWTIKNCPAFLRWRSQGRFPGGTGNWVCSEKFVGQFNRRKSEEHPLVERRGWVESTDRRRWRRSGQWVLVAKWWGSEKGEHFRFGRVSDCPKKMFVVLWWPGWLFRGPMFSIDSGVIYEMCKRRRAALWEIGWGSIESVLFCLWCLWRV